MGAQCRWKGNFGLLLAGAAAMLALSLPGAGAATFTEVTTVPGEILDATSTRVLYRPVDASGPIRVRDTSGGPDVTVPVRPGRELSDVGGQLFAGGVLYVSEATGGSITSAELEEWKTGDAAPTSLGSLNPSSLVIAGDYAIWNSPALGGNTLTRRHLPTGTNLVISTDAGNHANSVAGNGDVAFWGSDHEVYRWRNGITTKLSNASPLWSVWPITDGINTVWNRRPPCCQAGEQSVAFSDGSTEAVLPGSGSTTEEPLPSLDYDAAGGWIAYTRDGRTEVWTRENAGTLARVSGPAVPDSSPLFLLAMAPTGQVMYRRGVAEAFLGATGVTPYPLETSVQRAFWEGDRWYVMLTGAEGELLRVDTDTKITERPPAVTQATTADFVVASTARQPVLACELDGAPAACADGDHSAASLPDGSHTFTATSTDPDLGETDPTPASWTWMVDTTPPAPFAMGPPADGAVTNSGQLSWSPADDGAGSGIASYEVTLDGQSAGSTAGDQTSLVPPQGLTAGTHTWRVVAIDRAGNSRDGGTQSFVFDPDPPTAPELDRPADGEAVSTARPVLSWKAATDAVSGVTGYDVVVDGAATRVDAGATSFTPGADLADGEHTWRVVAIDAAGHRAESPLRRFTVDTRPPVARLAADPNPALAGQTVRFDAGASTPRAAPITRYEWDLDGDGGFETDTGAGSSAERTYGTPQDVEVRVRVTDAAGRAGTAQLALAVTPAPLPGPPGVSIDAGARFTTDPEVTLTLRWPLFARSMLIANDGGFEGAQPQPLAPQVQWRLDSVGARRLPRTVYVRFIGGLAGNETYQDDIVLDEAPPRVAAATVRVAGRRAGSRKRRYQIRVRAADEVSGLASLQLAADRRRPSGTRRYSSVVSTVSRLSPRWIRVTDRAGNRSDWRRLRAR
jgi:hypothetical protein